MAISYPYPMLIFLCLPSGVSDPAFTKLLKGVLSPRCSIGKKEVQNKTAVWECLLLSIRVFLGKPCVQGQCQVLGIQRWKMLDLWTLRTSVRDTTCHALEYDMVCVRSTTNMLWECTGRRGILPGELGTMSLKTWHWRLQRMSCASKNVQRLFC